jgi:hypothetical protein
MAALVGNVIGMPVNSIVDHGEKAAHAKAVDFSGFGMRERASLTFDVASCALEACIGHRVEHCTKEIH